MFARHRERSGCDDLGLCRRRPRLAIAVLPHAMSGAAAHPHSNRQSMIPLVNIQIEPTRRSPVAMMSRRTRGSFGALAGLDMESED